MMEDFNPWWFGEPDPDLQRLEKAKYRWNPPWIHWLGLSPGDLNIVTGPRRTGKTVGMKLLIRELLTKGVNPRAILYCGCDIFEDYREVYRLLRNYREEVKRGGIRPAYVFLDEVTAVESWWRAVKVFLDSFNPPWVLTVSGSSTLALGKSVEYFGGRRGGGKFLTVMPLSFHEFFEVVAKGRTDISSIFDLYLETGGYLARLNNMMDIRDFTLFTKADVLSAGKDPSLAKEVIGTMMRAAPNPVSFHSIASDVGVSVRTVREYMALFTDLFFLLPIVFRGMDGKIRWMKERKYAIRDPFMARSLSIWSSVPLERSVMVEWVVQEHLYRKYGEIYYFKNSFEIDAIAGREMVEIKSVKSRKRYPRGVRIISGEEVPRYLLSLEATSTSFM